MLRKPALDYIKDVLKLNNDIKQNKLTIVNKNNMMYLEYPCIMQPSEIKYDEEGEEIPPESEYVAGFLSAPIEIADYNKFIKPHKVSDDRHTKGTTKEV